MNKKLYQKIEEVVKPYCKCDWCLLKEISACKYSDPRFFIQLKAIEHFKYEESERQGRDIGWEEAHMLWVEQGFAKEFADFYDEELTAEDIYDKILAYRKK